MILVANKVDLMHLRKITQDQGKEMAAKHNVRPLGLFPSCSVAATWKLSKGAHKVE